MSLNEKKKEEASERLKSVYTTPIPLGSSHQEMFIDTLVDILYPEPEKDPTTWSSPPEGWKEKIGLEEKEVLDEEKPKRYNPGESHD